jgi:hypothetical protein
MAEDAEKPSVGIFCCGGAMSSAAELTGVAAFEVMNRLGPEEVGMGCVSALATGIPKRFRPICEHVEALSEALGEADVAHDMACRLDETQLYRLAVEHVCRNTCIVPVAILKVLEVATGIFLPGDCSIEFVAGAI